VVIRSSAQGPSIVLPAGTLTGLMRRPSRSAAEPDDGSAPEANDTVVRRMEVAGITLEIADLAGSVAAEAVRDEVGVGAYDFSDIPFEPGDVVIDIGAHVGIVSTWLARAHPGVRVLAFEPVPDLFRLLVGNLARNGVGNVEAANLAVTADGRAVDMVLHGSNTGGATSQLGLEVTDHRHYTVPSTTLDRIFDEHGIDRCRLLKIDCEGSEYEVLLTSRRLGRVEHLRGEFHENRHLRAQGYSMEALRRYCERYVDAGNIRYTPCQMAG
jgi:FkbM family methyltransferase